MRITFHGAAREVTGSLHLVEADACRVALDCGLFQGHRREADQKNRRLPFDPTSLTAVVLSHAHLDHTGRLPWLVQSGFAGPIYATPATRDLCAIMLADSAHIQEEDAKFLAKRAARGRIPASESPLPPLYDAAAVAATLRRFHSIPLNCPFPLGPTLTAEFHEAGHMLGSAGVRLIHQPPGDRPISLAFSGDVGRFNMPILRDPAPLPAADVLVCESTYGGRTSPPNDDLKNRLAEIFRETIARGGKVIIPAFSVGRTQVIVYYIHQLIEEGRLDRIPVYIDSPLAVDATEVFKLHPELFDAEARHFNRETGDMLGAACCTFVRDVEVSKSLNRRRRPCVIIAASGMCENGRILHHLRNNVGNAKNTVLIVGFQAAHTLGRRIVEKQSPLRIFGQNHPLRARVEVLNGFSAHADRDELRRLTRPRAAGVKRAFLVHGEPDQMEKMAAFMRADGYRDVIMPAPAESFELS